MKNIVTAILRCILSILVLLTMTACVRQQSASDQVAADLDQVRQEEIASDMEAIFGSADLADQYTDRYRQLLEKMQEFEYEVTGEKVSDEGSAADVTVAVTTYDFGGAYKTAREEIIRAAEEGEINIDTDLETYVYDVLFDKMLGLTDKTYTKEVVIKCEQKANGDWVANIHENQDLLDALLGGVISTSTEQAKASEPPQEAEPDTERENVEG